MHRARWRDLHGTPLADIRLMTEIVSEIKLTSLVGFICASQPLGFVRGALIGGPNLDGRVAAAALVAGR